MFFIVVSVRIPVEKINAQEVALPVPVVKERQEVVAAEERGEVRLPVVAGAAVLDIGSNLLTNHPIARWTPRERSVISYQCR